MRGSTILVVGLVISIVLNVFLLVAVIGGLQTEAGRQQIVSNYVAGAGMSAARLDFRFGISRLYELTSERDEKFTGRTEAPYEIWTRCNNADIGEFGANIAKSFVNSYNAQMREMHDHPELYTIDYEYRNAKVPRPKEPDDSDPEESGI